MKVDDFFLKLDQNQTLPVYFLYGEERFFQKEIIDSLTRLFITADNREFNLEKFDGKEGRVHDWLDATLTPSFLGGTKLVVARNLHETSFSDSQIQALGDYLADPAPETCLILTADAVDRKRKWVKKLIGLPGAVDCAAPKEAALVVWIKKRAQSQGQTMEASAARMLVDRVGARPGLLASELEKVSVYVGKSKQIREVDVQSVVGETRQENIFDLAEALKKKDAQSAVQVLHNQLDCGQEPLKVLGTIAWQFRVIWEVKFFQDSACPPGQIAQRMGANPFVVDKALKHTGNFTSPQLRRCFSGLGEADRELKTSGKNPRTILESLVLKLCSSGSV